jgi:hypothetical protein
VEPSFQKTKSSSKSRKSGGFSFFIKDKKRDTLPLWVKVLISILYVGGLIGCGFALAVATGVRSVKSEKTAAALLATKPQVCLQGRIQNRKQVTLFLALEGLTTNSVSDLDSILDLAVRDGYNKAAGGCHDACNRWAYLAKVESEANITLSGGTPAVYAEVLTYLSEYGCPAGQSFASVFPGQAGRMRRSLALEDGPPPNVFLSTSEEKLEPWPTAGEGQEDPQAGNGKGRSRFLSTFFLSDSALHERRELSKGLDFSAIIAAIEDELMKALEKYHNRAGFTGIQKVLLVQPNSDNQMSQVAYTRAGPALGAFTKMGKSNKAFGVSSGPPPKTGPPKTSKAPKATKAPNATKAPSSKAIKGSKATKAPSSKASKGGTKAPSSKATKAPSSKATKVYCSTKIPKSTKAPSTKAPLRRRLGNGASSGGSFQVGTVQLTDPTAVRFFDY